MSAFPAAGSVRITVSAALVAMSGLAFAPVFGGLGPSLLLAMVGPAATAAAWALWAQHSHAQHGYVPVGRVALGVLAVAVAIAATTRPGSAVASGPHRLLTGALPVDPSGPELATAATVCGYAALIGCCLALVRRSALAPVLPALSCLLAALSLGPITSELPVWYSPAFVALTGLLLIAGRLDETGQRAISSTGLRLIAPAAAVLAVAVAAPVVLANLAPGTGVREPADVRSLIAAPVLPKANVNPFAQYLALRDGDLTVKITGSASSAVDELRMVTLTEFDGRHWSVDGDYRRAGHQLPPAEITTDTRQVTVDVTVDPTDVLGWLPTAGRAARISVADLGVDEATGDVVIPAGSVPPEYYRVTGIEPVFDPGELPGYVPARAEAPLGVDLPPDILGFIKTWTRSERTEYGRLRALRDALKSAPFGQDRGDEATGGHSLYQISALLRDKRGTSEQYASAFAVMCRQLGWDARVVLGFRFDSTKTLTITGRDVHAWVEVRFDRLGWVPVNPTPIQASPGREGDNDQTPTQQSDPLESAPDSGQPIPPQSAASQGDSASSTPAGTQPWAIAAIIAGGTLTVLLLAVPVAKTIRRARRRRIGTPRTRTIAAWHEALDALRDTGQRLPRAATTGDIVTATATTCPPEMRALARDTDFAAFAPGEAHDGDAIAAWTHSDDIRRTTRQRLSVPARFRSAVNPRSLLIRYR